MINKRGLSGVVTMVILVALSIALVAIVWGVVQNLIQGNLDEAGSCSNLFGDSTVELNNRYTCDNITDIYFAINVGDIELDAILVKVEGSSVSKTYRLDSGSSSSNLVLYGGGSTQMPAKNSGLTYNLSAVSEGLVGPYSLSVSPIIDGHTCNEISRRNGIDRCFLVPDFP